MVTVRVCVECNQEKARNDLYLRDMLVADIHAASNPIAQQLLSGNVSRSFKTNRSDFARAARAKAKYEAMHSSGGIYLGHYPSVPLDGERIASIFKTIVRGLFYKLQKDVLPNDYEYECRRVDGFHVQALISDLQRVGINGPYLLGENVFACYFMYADTNPFLTYWLLCFYNSVFVTVSSEPTTDIVNAAR